jgi:hypothetical protein
MVSTTGKKYHLFATGQVSITDPNPGAGVVGNHPVQKVTKFTPPSSNPSAIRRPKPIGPGIINAITKHVAQFGVWYTNAVRQQVDEFGRVLTHLG